MHQAKMRKGKWSGRRRALNLPDGDIACWDSAEKGGLCKVWVGIVIVDQMGHFREGAS